MDPYYQDESVTLYHGEALNVLSSFSAGQFAAVVADPPYSSGGAFRSDRSAAPSAKYRGWSQNSDGSSRKPTHDYGSFGGDSRDQRSYVTWCSMWLSQCWRTSIPTAQAFVFTDWRQLPVTTDAVQAGGWTWRGLCVWDKGIGRPMKGRFRNHLEYVVWSSSGAMPQPDDVYPSTLLRHTPPTASSRVHVTQKPVELVDELLSIAPPGIVLDPFAGSGTTLESAKRLGRRAVGIEIDELHCETIAERMAQQSLEFG